MTCNKRIVEISLFLFVKCYRWVIFIFVTFLPDVFKMHCKLKHDLHFKKMLVLNIGVYREVELLISRVHVQLTFEAITPYLLEKSSRQSLPCVANTVVKESKKKSERDRHWFSRQCRRKSDEHFLISIIKLVTNLQRWKQQHLKINVFKT